MSSPANDSIDQAMLKSVLAYPESIVSIGEWQRYGVCLRCLGEINIKADCLKNMSGEFDKATKLVRHQCPHCGVAQSHEHTVTRRRKHAYRLGAIPHRMMRKRYITTRVTKRWFRLPIIEGVWECQIISDSTTK